MNRSASVRVLLLLAHILHLQHTLSTKLPDETCETLPSGEVNCKATTSTKDELCTIPRVPRSEMTEDIFQSKYYLQHPVIITNVDTAPDAAQGRWTTDILLQQYGAISVGTGSSRTITKMGGTGRASAKLGDIIEAVRTTEEHDGDVDVYAFERDSQLFDEAPELIDRLRDTAAAVLGAKFVSNKIPKRKWNSTKKLKHEKYRYFFSLGGVGSGVHLHHHSDGWSYLFEGQKRWFFRPPYTLPAVTHMGFMRMRYWLEEGVYPKLKKNEMPLECVQNPGELIYVPESWWHGTINEGGGGATTLSVAAQRRTATTKVEQQMNSALQLSHKGRNNKAFKMLQKIVKSMPNHAEAWYTLGIVYGRVRKHHLKDELESKLRANELTEGRNCDVLNNLATALIHYKRLEEAEKYLKQVIDLCPWDDFAWSNLAAALDGQNREEEAVVAFEKGKHVRKEWSTPSMVTVGKEELML